MANNNIIFNEVLIGAMAAMQRRWVTGVTDYAAQLAQAQELALLIDSIIPTDSALDDGDSRLMGAIVDNVISDRILLSNSSSQSAVAQAIISGWSAARNALLSSASIAGNQASYTIDPINGDDNAPGSVSEPMKTLAALGKRLSNIDWTVSITATVLSTPPSSDRLVIQGANVVAPNGFLNVVGTPTVVQSGITISAVVPLGGHLADGPPWQITTAGIDWTLQTERRVRLSQNNEFGFIGRVIDANNIVVIGFREATLNGVVTPTILDTLSLESAPAIATPSIRYSQRLLGGIIFSFKEPSVSLTEFDFVDKSISGYSLDAENIRLNGVKYLIEPNVKLVLTNHTVFQNCWVQVNSLAAAIIQAMGTAFGGTLITGNLNNQKFRLDGVALFEQCYWNSAGVRVQVNSFASLLNYCHFENALDPILIENGGMARSVTNPPSGSTGNTGHGVVLANGSHFYFSNGTLPVITGATGDVSISGATTAWAATPLEDPTTDSGVLLTG